MLGKIRLTSILPGLTFTATEIHQTEILDSTADALTATHLGTQSTALLIGARWARFTVVAADGDACRLPPAIAGLSITVRNAGAFTLAIFPASATQGGVAGGDSIDALGANAAYSLAAAAATLTLRSYVNGIWISG